MSSADQHKWDQRYRGTDAEPRAAAVLADNLHWLPKQGLALDLACGLGGNALLLAQRGLQVEAWDLSPVAIARLTERAAGLPLTAHVVDIHAGALGKARYDVITVSYFLDRGLAPAIIDALRPNGLLFYQTYTQTRLDRGPTNPAWRLYPNELPELFAPLNALLYREEPGSDVAMLIARK